MKIKNQKQDGRGAGPAILYGRRRNSFLKNRYIKTRIIKNKNKNNNENKNENKNKNKNGRGFFFRAPHKVPSKVPWRQRYLRGTSRYLGGAALKVP